MLILTEDILRTFVDKNYRFIEENFPKDLQIPTVLSKLKKFNSAEFLAAMQALRPVFYNALFDGDPKARSSGWMLLDYFSLAHIAKRMVLFIYFNSSPDLTAFAAFAVRQKIFISNYHATAFKVHYQLLPNTLISLPIAEPTAILIPIQAPAYQTALADTSCYILFFMRYYQLAAFSSDDSLAKAKKDLAQDIEYYVLQLLEVLNATPPLLSVLPEEFLKLGQILQNAIKLHNLQRGFFSAGRFGWCLENCQIRYNKYCQQLKLPQIR